MSGVRETFERNSEGLNDLYLRFEHDIKNSIQKLLDEEKYEDALTVIDDQIANAILEFEKQKRNVTEILQTRLKLSFDDKNKGIIGEWDNAIITAKSKIEMLGGTLKANINEKVTTFVRIPAIEKFLLDSASAKAFTRLPFETISKRLKVPIKKVEEIAENLIFDGKLKASIDLVGGSIIFIDESRPPDTSITPAPKPRPISSISSDEDIPQPIGIDTSIPESPEQLDLSLEPPDFTEGGVETSPEGFELPPDMNFTETIDISTGTSTPASPAQESVENAQKIPTGVSDEEKEARNIISFFKSSVDELSEDDKAEARRKREEKKKELMEAKKKKMKEAEKKKEEPPSEPPKIPEPSKAPASPFRSAGDISTPSTPSKETVKPSFRPAGDISVSSDDLLSQIESVEEKAIAPSKKEVTAEISPEKRVTCSVCEKQVSKDDPTVIPCPHACGAYGHKDEFLEKGYCPKCNEEIKDVDIEFSTLL